MRLRTLGVLVGLLLAGCASHQPQKAAEADTKQPAPTPPTAAVGLSDYVDRDFSTLTPQALSSFEQRLAGLTERHPVPEGAWNWYQPRWVRSFRSGNIEWVALEVLPLWSVPGVCGVRANCFDAEWRLVAVHEFPCGYRQDVAFADIQRDNPLGCDLLRVAVVYGPVGDQRSGLPVLDDSYQMAEYFALRPDGPLLVRVEDSKKGIMQNFYEWTRPYTGPDVPDRVPSEWIDALNSPDQAVQLSTLVWLTGHHLSSSEARFPNTSQESVRRSEAFEIVCKQSATNILVKRYCESPNRWIQEYAQLAAGQMNSPSGSKRVDRGVGVSR